ncbi:MAG: enoyl-[acyl-carrier-protein] reductase, partial [Bdellovibrionota bacterium]
MLNINLSGKLALVAGVADDQGYGWAIAKALRRAGAKVIITTWPPALNILRMSLERGKLDTDMGDGTQLTFEKVYPLDAMYDELGDVPEDVRNNKRYVDLGDYTVRGLRDAIEKD